MKKKGVIAAVLAISCMFCATGCGESEFLALVQSEVTDLNYVGVRENLTIVSNVYEEVDLVSLGLDKDAYFLFGDRDNLYFGVQGSFTLKDDVWSNNVNQGKVVVMKYNLESNQLIQCSAMDSANRVAMKDADTFVYFTYQREGMLGYFDYYCIIRELNAEGVVKNSSKVEFDGKTNSFEVKIDQYMNSVSDYYWGNKPSDSILYTYNPVLYDNEFIYYDPYGITDSEDTLWNFTSEQMRSAETEYFATDNNYVVIRRDYYESKFFFNDYYNVYYAYDIGGDVQFLFSESDDASKPIGLYVI